MRLNKYIAQNTHLSRRQADEAIKSARITVNSKTAVLGDTVDDDDIVTLDNKPISINSENVTIILNKPVGYVCSRDGQGSPTVYDLIPKKFENLNIAGRLDKDSSGLVILTSDGDLLYELTHPSKNKEKTYEVEIDRELTEDDLNNLKKGVNIGDERLSKFKDVEIIGPKKYRIILEEGRNRQIRRSIEKVNANVTKLHRISIAEYELGSTEEAKYLIA